MLVATQVIRPLGAGIKAELPSLIEAIKAPALMCTPNVAYKFKDGQHAASFHHRSPRCHTSISARPHTVLSYHLYPVSSWLVEDFCGLARTRGPCSQDAFTPDAAILAKSHTYWRKRKRDRDVGTTPPTSPPSTRFHLKLPPTCPLSPPLPQTVVPPIVSDTRTVCDLHSSLPRPDADKESTPFMRSSVTLAMNSNLSCV